MKYIFPLVLLCMVSCADSSEDECYSDTDCLEGQKCVISHDHEGDDHDHGGSCEAVDTAE